MSANAAINPERLPFELRKDEGDAIRARRQAAGLHVASAAPTADVEGADSAANGRSSPLALPDDLVGLALSGGGIRSASFNLGLLQAFHQRGLLRHIDYLSTVSGGGYIGGYLTSLVRHGSTDILAAERKEDFPLHPEPGGKQPPAVRNLIRGGDYLDRQAEFTSRYLLGLGLNSLVLGSGLVAFGALVAFSWRLLDTPSIHSWLSEISDERVLDKNRPFLPFVLSMGLWLCCWIAVAITSCVSLRWSRRASTAARGCLLAAGLLLLGGAVVWLATPNINVHKPMDWESTPTGSGTAPENMVSEHRFLLIGLAVVGTLCLLPILRPWRLLASGIQPRNPVERWTFKLATGVALASILLVPVFFFSRHNFSGHAASRGPELILTDIRTWDNFWSHVKHEGQEWERISAQTDQRLNAPNMPLVGAPEQTGRQHKEGEQPPENLVRLLPGAYIWSQLDLDQETRRLIDDAPAAVQHPWPHDGNLREAKARAVKQLSNILFGRESSSPGAYEFSAGDLFPSQIEEWPIPRAFTPKDSGRAETPPEPVLETMRGFAGLPAFQEPEFLRSLGMISLPEEPERAKLRDDASRAIEGLKYFSQAERSELRNLLEKRSALQEQLPVQKTARLNRLLLKTYFPGDVWPQSFVRRSVCIVPDQRARIAWFVCAAVVFLTSGCLVNFNSTSMHAFYRDRLSEAYVEQGRRAALRLYSSANPPLSADEPLLDELRPNIFEKGAPYPLFLATLNRFRRPKKEEPTDGFLLSPGWCGSKTTGYVKTSEYSKNRELTLSDAMAISGAAVSPPQVGNLTLSAFMLVLNLRLGQWLRNPKRPQRRGWIAPLQVVADMYLRSEEHRRYCFLSDGGHHENLGLWPLLERECRLMIVSDAGQDPEHSLADFTKLFRQARLELGVEFQEPDGQPCVEMAHLIPDPSNGLCPRHDCILKVRYRSGTEALVVYLKPSLTGDEDFDLTRYRAENSGFPHDPTTDQLYDANQFESYRQMGFHIGEKLCNDLPVNLWESTQSVERLSEMLLRGCENRPPTRPRYRLRFRRRPFQFDEAVLIGLIHHLAEALQSAQRDAVAWPRPQQPADAASPGSGTTSFEVDVATAKALIVGMKSLSTFTHDWAVNDGQRDVHRNAMQVVRLLIHWTAGNITPAGRLELSAPAVAALFHELQAPLEEIVKQLSGDAAQSAPNPGDAPNADSNGASGASVQA